MLFWIKKPGFICIYLIETLFVSDAMDRMFDLCTAEEWVDDPKQLKKCLFIQLIRKWR